MIRRLVWIAVIIIIAGLIRECKAQAYTSNEVCNAIYQAEGGKNASKPYGVFHRDCSWSNPERCRKFCIQIVERFYSDSKSVEKLGEIYAPVGARNDPKKLNEHWVENVTWFLEHKK